MGKRIQSLYDLDVFKLAFTSANSIYLLSKSFPVEEKYSLTDQIRRSSRSVCANISEAWRKRRYSAAFVCKLNDAEAEASETQVWLMFCEECGYLDSKTVTDLITNYDHILGKLVNMIRSVDKWILKE